MIEHIILGNLLRDEEYTRKVIPYLKTEYFSDIHNQLVFDAVSDYVKTYNGVPSKQAILLALEKRDDLNEDSFGHVVEVVENLPSDEVKKEWIEEETEKFCQDRSVFNAVRRSILILDGKDPQYTKTAIPDILSKALSVSFDTNIGHDFLDNSEERYEFYHTIEERIPFDLDYFNKITKGGLPRKSLGVILAGTGAGKTLFMCHCAANNMMMSKNVLYITLEMSEERIAERIDANLMDITLDDLVLLTPEIYQARIDRIKKRTKGKIIIKEYPTTSANVNHFRFLLNELKIKKNFVPDIVYIDYLNICASSRMKMGGSVNSYSYVKAIAEEVRGLAVEFDIPIMTATQTNRSGFNDSDVDLTSTSESFGIPVTADFMFALINTEELEELNQLMVKQLKNRWGDITSPGRFLIGVDRPKMKLYNLEESAQANLRPKKEEKDDGPVMDKTTFGSRMSAERFDTFR